MNGLFAEYQSKMIARPEYRRAEENRFRETTEYVRDALRDSSKYDFEKLCDRCDFVVRTATTADGSCYRRELFREFIEFYKTQKFTTASNATSVANLAAVTRYAHQNGLLKRDPEIFFKKIFYDKESVLLAVL